MDFVFDADSYEASDSLPAPSAPLKLTNFQIQNDITKKLSKLNILKTINDRFADDDSSASNGQQAGSGGDPEATNGTIGAAGGSGEESVAFKYARNSLDLVSSHNTPVPASESQRRDVDSRILGNRLSRVLNQNNYDPSLRQSLGMLDTRVQEYEHLTSIGAQGSVARRKLRSGVEEEILKQHYLALRRFQPIAEKLEYLKGDLEEVNKNYDEVSSQLQDALQKSSEVRETVGDKMRHRDVLRAQKSLLQSFRRNFSLNQYEEHYLRSEPIDDEYFKILEKVGQIHRNCDILLSMENDKLGVSLMRQMSRLTDLATDRMTSYLKRNLNDNNRARDPHSVALLQKALVYIRKHSIEKFNSIVGDLIETRSRAVCDEFQQQLRGYSTAAQRGNKKMLYMSSYDSKRFASDVLAYVHSVIVNELELAESLFTFDRGEMAEELGLVIESVGNKVVGSLGRPLRSAFESCLRQESKPGAIIDLYELLDLYGMMYGKLIDADKSELIRTLDQLKTETREKLISLIQVRLKELRVESEAEEVEEDFLGLPDWLSDFYAVYMAVAESNCDMDMSDDEKEHLYSMLVDEPISLLDNVAKKLPYSKRSKLVFRINGLDFIHSKIEVIPRLKNKSNDVKDKLDELVSQLSADEFDRLLKSSGLYDIYNLINMIFKLEDDFFDVSIYEPIKENKLFNVKTFQEANTKLGQFIAEYITSNDLNNIISPTILTDVSVDPSVKFVKFYDRLCRIVSEYLTVDGQPVPVFQWDTGHIATLLGVEDNFSLLPSDHEGDDDDDDDEDTTIETSRDM